MRTLEPGKLRLIAAVVLVELGQHRLVMSRGGAGVGRVKGENRARVWLHNEYLKVVRSMSRAAQKCRVRFRVGVGVGVGPSYIAHQCVDEGARRDAGVRAHLRCPLLRAW